MESLMELAELLRGNWPERTAEAAAGVQPAEQALIARCLAGEEAAYALLYQRYAATIYRLVYSLLQHRQDAEEVLQDSFEYAFRRLEAYDERRASFKTWLYRIAVSRSRNKRRRRWLPALPLTQEAGEQINAAVTVGALRVGADAGAPLHHFPLEQTAAAHDAVESGAIGKVLIDVE